jgi:flagellar basal body rod protein FlgF
MINVSVTGANAIPAGATAAVLNVTAVNPAGPGFLSVYPEGNARPLASNVNYVGKAVANRVVVPLSTTGGSLGQITVYSSQSADVVVDVSGYFSAAGGTGSQFNAEAAPLRICDTRSQSPSNVCTGKSIGQGGTLTLNVAGLAGVPGNATAVVVNLTGVTPPEGTFLTVFPGPRLPPTSDLNLSTGDVRANLVVAKLSSNGTISIANGDATTNVVVDVLGWYATPPG